MKKFIGAAALLVLLGGLYLKAAPPAPTIDPMAEFKSSDPDALTGFAAQFKGHLVSLQDGKLKSFDAATLQGVKFWAFYYSASWCPPCRAFTPKLVDFYKEFKAQHPNFELIFVCHDEDEDAMLKYMTTDAMAWPAVRFSDIENKRVEANKYCGSGIPDLVLVDANGKILSNSFNGEDYVGPYKVLEDIRKMVPAP